MKILADASLPCLREAFPEPFSLSLYHDVEELAQKIKQADALICRSTTKIDEPLLSDSQLRYVATASAGVDHIDHKALAKRDITLIDAKGANAHAVADYVMTVIAYLKIHHHLKMKRAGIIGLGHVGSAVAERLRSLDLSLCCYDPLKAEKDKSFESCDLNMLQSCELILIHANLHAEPPFPSLNLIDEKFLHNISEHTVIINAARGGIVNESALLSLKKPLYYCTDVYENEPRIQRAVVDYATIATPHIAGHSIEAKDKAVMLISRFFHQILKLPPPPDKLPTAKTTIHCDKDHWAEAVLSVYNPEIETSLLKHARSLENDFAKLRKAHCFRHDFYLPRL